MKWPVEKKIMGGFGLLLTILIIIGVISFQSALKFTETSRLETKSRVILKKLEIVLTEITDSETGQRGYIITGDERYLVPYHAAVANIDHEVEELSKLIRDNPDHQRKLDALKPLLAEKLAGLNERIGLRKNKGFEATAQEVRSGKGRMVMDKIRKIITEIEDAEKKFLKQRSTKVETSANRTIFIIVFGSSLAFVIVGIASFITHREFNERKRTEEALQNAYAELEQKVEERTTELRKINESLQKEITERKRAEEKIRVYQEQLQSLASQLSITEERERHRIATDLHDYIGQTLALCQIKLGALRESASPTLAASVDGIRDLIEQTIHYTRSLTSEPSDPL